MASKVFKEEKSPEDVAKEKELQKWKDFEVYEEVVNKGQSTISVRWVVTQKDVLKARLVARGFEEKDDIRSDSPTVSKEVLRIFFTVCSAKNWQPRSMDVTAAFLQSRGLGREVYLKPPKEAKCEKNILWKLKKCVYGLNDAARKWFYTVRTFLLKMNCKQIRSDPAAYYCYNGENLVGVFLMHVDDFIWSGNKWFENTIINNVRRTFKIREESCDIFK